MQRLNGAFDQPIWPRGPEPDLNVRIALYQPDIPPNTGTLLRLGACLGVAVDIIEPCGFPFSEQSLKRAGMDYLGHVTLRKHLSWANFLEFLSTDMPDARLVLLTTRGADCYTEYSFRSNDVILLGQESAGVPEDVHARADARVRIPMTRGMRSLNVAVAGAMVIGEALRQTQQFPDNGGDQT